MVSCLLAPDGSLLRAGRSPTAVLTARLTLTSGLSGATCPLSTGLSSLLALLASPGLLACLCLPTLGWALLAAAGLSPL